MNDLAILGGVVEILMQLCPILHVCQHKCSLVRHLTAKVLEVFNTLSGRWPMEIDGIIGTSLDMFFIFSGLMHKPTYDVLALCSSIICCMIAGESLNTAVSSATSRSASLPDRQLIPYCGLFRDFVIHGNLLKLSRWYFNVSRYTDNSTFPDGLSCE